MPLLAMCGRQDVSDHVHMYDRDERCARVSVHVCVWGVMNCRACGVKAVVQGGDLLFGLFICTNQPALPSLPLCLSPSLL